MGIEKKIGMFDELEDRLIDELFDVAVGLLQFKISELCSVYSVKAETMEQADKMVFLWTTPNGVSYGTPDGVMKEWFMPYVAELYKKMLESGKYDPYKLCKAMLAEVDKITVELMGE